MTRAKQLQRRGASATPARSVRDALGRAARGIVFPAVEAGNAGVFCLMGLLWRPNPARLVPSGEDRVLVLAPHPDDETLGCGGTICRHLAAGDEVCLAFITDGGNSRAGGLDRETMVALRREEAGEAVAALEQGSTPSIKQSILGLPEGQWKREALVGHLARLLKDFVPTVVYTTSRVDFHPEHLRVAAALGEALRGEAGKHVERVRAYELQVPLTPVLANLISPVEAAQKRKERALATYRTQAGSFLWVPRHSRYLRALYRQEGPVEVFWEMSAREYSALHAKEEATRSGAFRSIRLRPFTDLACWAIGLQERLALRRPAR
jgi:LmbE family N-acetylglucosaminyl deacetylase